MQKYAITFGIVLNFISYFVSAKTFDPHNELYYAEVPSKKSCGIRSQDERYYLITNICKESYLAIYRMISDYGRTIEIYKLEPGKTKPWLKEYSLWYNLYDIEEIDSKCGNGVAAFLLKHSFYEGELGDKLFHIKDYEQYFALTLEDEYVNLYCHAENIEKASH